MNKVIKSILFGIAFFPLTGCLSNLDLHPIDSDTPNTFFKDSAACAKVLVGCYDALSVPGGGLFDGSMNSQFVICIMQQPEQVLRCIAILPDMLLMLLCTRIFMRRFSVAVSSFIIFLMPR